MQKTSYASIEYSNIERKACFSVNQEANVNSWKQEYVVQMWEALLNPLSVNPTKWSSTLKQFVSNSQLIAWWVSFFFSRDTWGEQGIITWTDFICQGFWFGLLCKARSIKAKQRQVVWKCTLLPKNIRSLYVTFIYDIKLREFKCGINFWPAFLSLANFLLAG